MELLVADRFGSVVERRCLPLSWIVDDTDDDRPVFPLGRLGIGEEGWIVLKDAGMHHICLAIRTMLLHLPIPAARPCITIPKDLKVFHNVQRPMGAG
jgi:hypothetical protein